MIAVERRTRTGSPATVVPAGILPSPTANVMWRVKAEGGVAPALGTAGVRVEMVTGRVVTVVVPVVREAKTE